MNVIRGNWNEDFYISEVNGSSKCKKVADLYNEILRHKDRISEPTTIVLILCKGYGIIFLVNFWL